MSSGKRLMAAAARTRALETWLRSRLDRLRPNAEGERVLAQRTVIEQLAQRGRRLGAPRLLAVQAVEVQVQEHRKAVERVHPSRRIACGRKWIIL